MKTRAVLKYFVTDFRISANTQRCDNVAVTSQRCVANAHCCGFVDATMSNLQVAPTLPQRQVVSLTHIVLWI